MFLFFGQAMRDPGYKTPSLQLIFGRRWRDQRTTKRTACRHGRLRWLCLLAAFLVLSGCAAKMGPPQPEIQSSEAIWQAFWSRNAARPADPVGFRLKASLNYASEEESHRVRLSMWGNYQLPLRLDLASSFGSPFSLWQLTEEQWLAYQPRREMAYVHADSRRGAARLGVKTPFGLQTLCWILTADWNSLVPRHYVQTRPAGDNGVRYHLDEGALMDSLVLDRQSRLVELAGSSPYPWRLRLDEPEHFDGRLVSTLVTLTTQAGYSARVHLKELTLRTALWPKSSLQLDLPKDTMIVPLEYRSPDQYPKSSGG